MADERNNQKFSATEGHAPVAFSEWTQKLRFDRSFTAKLILSDDKVKGFYAEIASALLRYQKVKSRTGWSGVSFSVGRERFAFIAVIGKTLSVYLATDPEEEGGRYRAKDVSAVKARAKTPSLYKIKSDGAKKHVLRLIEDAAKKENLALRSEEEQSIPLSAFKTDTFNNLITRGLIHIVRKGDTSHAATPLSARIKRSGAYADTVETVDSLVKRHGVYDEILTAFSEGESKARLTQKQMLRSVDEIWVRAIEDCLSAMDELIRNPNHFIAETEEVLPIERTKRISGRSIAHLGRHTDYLSMQPNGEYTPTKMLNVFREDSILTYENKFLNTLINRLYAFISRRYKVAQTYGADETLETFEFESNFTHGEGKGKIKLCVEYAERNLNADAKNVLSGTGLWRRVERLNDVVTGYVNSPFAKEMGRNFVHAPILRTNSILKNKYFRECLALWEFIESYDDAGYGIAVEERDRELSDETVREVFQGAAMQYLLFKRAIDGETGEEIDDEYETLPDFIVDAVSRERYSETFSAEEYEDAADDDLTFALQVALLADERTDGNQTAATVLKKTFHAKLRTADSSVKELFANLANALLCYRGVRMRHSHRYASFYHGRRRLLKITVNGKALKAYFALDGQAVPQKYNLTDVSEKKTFSDTPLCLKVRGTRSVKHAEELIALLAESYGLTLSKTAVQTVQASDYPEEPLAEMLQKGWVSFAKKRDFMTRAASGISFGTTKHASVETHARETSALSVKESTAAKQSSAAKQPTSPETAENGAVTPTSDARLVAMEIAGLIRPGGNYENPTDYGIDDTSSFMTDELESNRNRELQAQAQDADETDLKNKDEQEL